MTPLAVIALVAASVTPPHTGGGPVAPPRLPAAEVADRAVRADDPAAPVGVVGVVVGGWGDHTLYVQDSSGGVTVALAAPADLPP
ncbi:MAG: hypothetical protein K2X82_09675, partial [Gemmataceae bacterium]|nr:hypothetical protein [Gemmataceae bacterium]